MYKASSVPRCQRCTKKKNKKKITLYGMVIGAFAVQFFITFLCIVMHNITLLATVA